MTIGEMKRVATIATEALREESTSHIEAVGLPKVSQSGESATFVALIDGVAFKFYMQEVS